MLYRRSPGSGSLPEDGWGDFSNLVSNVRNALGGMWEGGKCVPPPPGGEKKKKIAKISVTKWDLEGSRQALQTACELSGDSPVCARAAALPHVCGRWRPLQASHPSAKVPPRRPLSAGAAARGSDIGLQKNLNDVCREGPERLARCWRPQKFEAKQTTSARKLKTILARQRQRSSFARTV